MKSPKEMKVSGMGTYGVSGDVDLIYIHQNFPFALQSRVNPHANLEVLPLTLQSEIKQHQIISLIKGNC